MRQYRGKRIDNGNWVYGCYVERFWDGVSPASYIITRKCTTDNWLDLLFPVIPETVGQYIGVKDIKGVEIYEGDDVSTGFWGGIVEFKEGAFKIVKKGCSDSSNFDAIKVIGNIHEKKNKEKG